MKQESIRPTLHRPFITYALCIYFFGNGSMHSDKLGIFNHHIQTVGNIKMSACSVKKLSSTEESTSILHNRKQLVFWC